MDKVHMINQLTARFDNMFQREMKLQEQVEILQQQLTALANADNRVLVTTGIGAWYTVDKERVQ